MLSCFSHVRLFATLWTAARQAPLSMGFSRQEYWRGLPCPPLGDLPEPGMEPVSPALAGGFFTTSATWGFYGSSTQVVWKLLGIWSKSLSASSKESRGWVAHPEPIVEGGSVCVCALSLIHVWLCDPMDYNLPGSSVHGILQARILEWIAISQENQILQNYITKFEFPMILPPSCWQFHGWYRFAPVFLLT